MSHDPGVARGKLTAFIETIAETALASAALDKLTGDEQAAMRKTVARLTGAVEELEKVIGEHPHASAQAHALTELWGALGAAFLIGNRAAENPITERIVRDEEEASAANARRVKAELIESGDRAIIECVHSMWKNRPTLQSSAGATAAEIIESGALPGLKIGSSALEKRVRKLMKDGSLDSLPTISRKAGQASV